MVLSVVIATPRLWQSRGVPVTTARPQLRGAGLAARVGGPARVPRPASVGRAVHTVRRRSTTITALPKALRGELAGDATLASSLHEATRQEADGGTTVKWLFGLDGGAAVETVLMHYPGRTTVCVSSQAGCAMACGFCATGQAGFTRHLTTGEIVEQVVRAAGEAKRSDRRLSNVVFMGMGEPLANYDATWAAVERMHTDARTFGAPHHDLDSRYRPGHSPVGP